jgi:DNA-directed RNA polymerase subunit H (RpoH/RPB5)
MEIFQIVKSEGQKIESIIHHVLLMLSRRIYMDNAKEKQPLIILDKTAKPEISSDNVFIIKARNGDEYAIKILFQEIKSSGKNSPITEFIKEYPKYHKIIIASGFSNKVADFCSKHKIQIFRENSMLEDVLSQRDQPIFELLSPAEMKKVQEEYNVTNYTINKTIFKTDITASYLGLKKRDIFRVLRPTPTSGYSIAYRIVE